MPYHFIEYRRKPRTRAKDLAMGAIGGGLSVGLWYEFPGMMAQAMISGVMLLGLWWAGAETMELFGDWEWLDPVSRFLRVWAVLGWWVLFGIVCFVCSWVVEVVAV